MKTAYHEAFKEHSIIPTRREIEIMIELLDHAAMAKEYNSPPDYLKLVRTMRTTFRSMIER